MAQRVLWIFCALLLTGCPTEDPLPDGGGLGVEGDSCEKTEQCRPEYVCAGDGTCQSRGQPGTALAGDGCGSTSDCIRELICTSKRICGQPGAAAEGDPCIGDESCQLGLVCSSDLKCAEPGSVGAKLQGEDCAAPTECALGLLCVAAKCQVLAYWQGASCKDDATECAASEPRCPEGRQCVNDLCVRAPRSYFEIPRGDVPLADFYRLPFPNNIRLVDGHVDVMNHPNPGIVLPAPYDNVVTSYYEQIGRDVTGFGLNSSVFFRFSEQIDFNTVDLKGDIPAMQFLDITPDSPGYGRGVDLQLGAATSRGKYICQNWMHVRPSVGKPLRPATTYAVLLREGIKTEQGDALVQDDDFALMLAATEPSDADVKRAWQAYQPLRDFLADQQIDASTVLSAAVFTTMDPHAKMQGIKQAVEAAAAPELTNLTLCEAGATSPCADAADDTRVCASAADSAFHELHGSYQTPVFQRGTAPYFTPAEGGDIAFDASGVAEHVRDEAMCAGLSIPKGATMPTEGWPVVVFAHGTGGNFRSFVNNGTAAALAEVKDASGAVIDRLAVISTDGAMHGPRRSTEQAPDMLFFNLLNPKSARDNVYQGAADKLQLLRLVKSVEVDAASSPTGEAIKFDPARIYFFGHSQGTIEGLPFLSVDSDVKATVLSGAGGYLIGSLLGKRKPLDVASLVQLALADGSVSSTHPLLNLLQLYFDEVDSINYGRTLVSEPLEGQTAKHVFLSFGAEDSFTPPGTITALTRAMGLRQVTRCGDGACTAEETCNTCAQDCPSDACEEHDTTFGQIDAPVSGNVTQGGESYTAAMVKYKGDGSYDDHQVLFREPTAKQQSTHFLGTAARDGVPEIP